MKIVFLVERPTQFEAPFYQYVARHVEKLPSADTLRVVFTATDVGAPVYDQELGHTVDWGIPLLSGYSFVVLPAHDRHDRHDRRQALAQELRPERCDLLITNGYKGPDVKQALELADRAGIATALRLDAVRGGWWPRRTARRLRFATSLRGRYDVFLGAGHETLRFLKQCGIGKARLGLFPYAVDVEGFRARGKILAPGRDERRASLGVPVDAKVVLAVCKLNEREAPRDLIKALSRLGREVRLLVAGDGPDQRELEELAEKTAPGRFRFLGYVTYLDLPGLYTAADLFVHAVREEHWGVSVAEAMACGLPVITSSTVGAGQDLIRRSKNGFVYPVGNEKALARSIHRALKLPLEEVRLTNEDILARWDYRAAWEGLLEAAGRAGARPRRRER